jgi:hypothetical protein
MEGVAVRMTEGEVLTQPTGSVMIATMNKVRLVVEIDEELRDALRAESGLRGEGMAEIVEQLFRENFANTIKQIRERRKHADKGKTPKKNGE